eukprot:scaffold319567_cov18-Prasinocladus_malaysianus.AAC.1
MFVCQADMFLASADGKTTAVNKKEIPKLIEGMFLFALVWSIGASTETDGRAKFSAFLRKLVNNEVDKAEDRSDFDLGPGLTIIDPGFK